MLKVISYEATLNPKARLDTTGKNEILVKFIQGVCSVGDNGILESKNIITPADAAVMVGWVHENSKSTPHLNFRKQVFDYQQSLKKKTIFADSNLFLYANSSNPHRYLRYSFDGVFPNNGNYCDDTPDPSRWQTISKDMNLSLKDYRKNGHHILLCLQRNGGWSMGGIDVIDWACKTIDEIRKHSDREIVIRAHPGDKGSSKYLGYKNLIDKIRLLKGIRVSKPGTTLVQDLHKCWAVVNFNSSPTVGAAIEGYPIFVTDPTRSQCREIANTDLSKIESPILFDRQPWIERISMFHWSFDQVLSGECWTHMRKYV